MAGDVGGAVFELSDPPTEAEKDRMYELEMDDIEKQMKQIDEATHPKLLEAFREFEAQKRFAQNCATAHNKTLLDGAKQDKKRAEKDVRESGKTAKTEARNRIIAELQQESEKCKEWCENSRIDNTNDGRDIRQTRKMRAARGSEKEEADAAEAVLKAQKTAHEQGKRQLQLVQMELDSNDVEQDILKLSNSKSKSSHAAKNSKPQPETFECYYEHTVLADDKYAGDRLKFKDKWYYRGVKVTLEKVAAHSKVTGMIFMFTPTHIWIRRQNLTKYSVPLSELIKGSTTLRMATGREQ